MLTNIKIDLEKLKSNQLNESFVAEFAADVKYILSHILSPSLFPDITKLKEQEEEKDPKIIIKGSKEDVRAFAQVLNKEKEYAKDYIEHGLGSSSLSDSKIELEKSIHHFEKETGLVWPLR